MKKSTINVGIIGGGFGYYGHYKALNLIKDVKVIAIATKREIKLHKGIKVYDDPLKLISNKKIDFITVATIPELQERLLPRLVKKKIPIFLEKPLGLNYKKICKYSSNFKKFGINFTFPEIDEFKYLKKKLHNHKSKQVRINWLFNAKHLTSKTWKVDKKKGGGIIYNYFSHVLYYINFIFGKIQSIEIQKKNNFLFKCQILVSNKISINFTLNAKYSGVPRHEIVVKEPNIKLKTNEPLRFGKFKIYKKNKIININKNIKSTSSDNRYIYVAKILKRFINSQYKNKPFSPNLNDGLENLKWINKIEKI